MSNLFRPSVCIDAVFEGVPKKDAIASVKSCGIDAIEFWGWWDKDLDEIERSVAEHSMTISACCTKFISLVNPACRDAYLEGLRESIDAATRLKCSTLISQVGDFRPGVDRRDQHQSLVDGLRAAAPMLEQSGITLVFEPLNERIDHVGYYLVYSNEAFDIVDEVASPNVKVVFDIYHQQISEGDVIRNATENIDKVGHFHAAGNPGRHELTRGELDYRQVLAAIGSAGFNGYCGLEYWPLDDPKAGLVEAASFFVDTDAQ
ncbi:MAG: TIM barrel protein [Planctomycetota bacterium]